MAGCDAILSVYYCVRSPPRYCGQQISLSQPRSIALLIGSTVLVAAAALVTLDLGNEPEGPLLVDPTEVVAPVSNDSLPRVEDIRSTGVREGTDTEVADETQSSSGVGMISGRVSVNTSILDQLSRFTIVIQEEVNLNARDEDDPAPYSRSETYPAGATKGTPYFDIEDVPFSRYPYRVTVVAKGLNGSSDIVYLRPNSSLESREAQLTLSPGTYYSITIRDQRQNPRSDLIIRMAPVGNSLTQRDSHFGTTDSTGHVLFENVLSGEYEIRVGPANALLAPPKKTMVTSVPFVLSGGQPQPQGTTVVVPDGHDVTIEVTSRWGYALENVELKLNEIDVQRYYEYKGTTDRAGRFVFKNIPYGRYHLSVTSEEHGRRDPPEFWVKEEDPPPTVQVRMSR